MRILLFIAALAATWFACDRWLMVAEAATGGPRLMQIGDCNLPQPSERATLVFASYYEGAAVSTVRLGDPESTDATSTLEMHVAPGVGSLYVVVAGGRHNVLRLTGWTKRVERLVVVTRPDYPTAVTGLPETIVQFADANSCGGPLADVYKAPPGADLSFLAGVVKRPFPESMSAEERSRQKTMWRMPDVIGGGYDPDRMTISEWGIAATIYKPHDSASGLPDWYRATRADDYSPGGIVPIDTASLISPVPSEPYKVLPGRAGLGQLLRDDKIARVDSETYRVLTQIDVPQGLCGALSVTFILDPAVREPTGDLCHSKIR
jgi:hypothetical protein